MLKKMILLGVMVLLLASLGNTALAQDMDEWAASVRAANEGTEIIIAVASHPSVEAFKPMIREFEEMTGITVRLDEVEEGQLGQKLTLEVANNVTSYDAVMASVERNPRLASAGYSEPPRSLDQQLNDNAGLVRL